MTRAISTISGFIVAPPGFKAKRMSTRTIEYATTQASPARAAKLPTKSRNEDPGAVIPDELSGGAGFDVAGAGTVLCVCVLIAGYLCCRKRAEPKDKINGGWSAGGGKAVTANYPDKPPNYTAGDGLYKTDVL